MTGCDNNEVSYQLAKWAEVMIGEKVKFKKAVSQALADNPWFTEEDIQFAFESIVHNYLDSAKLRQWLEHYRVDNRGRTKNIGLILAGNVPMVGFHDLLCVLACGHKALVKVSSKDQAMMSFALYCLKKFDSIFSDLFVCVERLSGYDAVIATGSNLSASYFNKYFHHVPHIVRHHRNSVAILNGAETPDDLFLLADDVFRYFGLGCRNVSKIYVPPKYDPTTLIDVFNEAYAGIMQHTKYKNNYDYQLAMFLLNGIQFYQGENLLLMQEQKIASPMACLYYEEYSDIRTLKERLAQSDHLIQAISSAARLEGIETVPFGKLQQPSLFDYADKVDTMQFLIDLKYAAE